MEYTLEPMKSDKVTGLVAQNAATSFNVSFPEGWETAQIQKIKIHNILVSAELSTTSDMDFDLNFFGKDVQATTGTDTSAEDFMGMVAFVAADSEIWTGGGATFRYTKDLADNPILYSDLDHSGELHVTLVVRSATSFAAADNVQITFMVTPVL